MPTCWIIAGPTGAGKTTFALEYLPRVVGCTHFINADLIAAGLSPPAPEREIVSAGRILLHESEERIAKGEDFAYATTLAGRGYLRLIRRLQSLGWLVELIYLALSSVEMSRLRVAERATHGGHSNSIPPKDIERRFARSLQNLLLDYSPAVNACQCFFNNIEPALIFEQQGAERNIVDDSLYQLYQQLLNEPGL